MRKVLRWGLVGAGDIAEKRVAPALANGTRSRLAAVSRRRAELAQVFADRFGAARAHQSWQELLRDDEVDAVYVATPVNLHAEITVAAARAGKHVLCEKPMALSVAECDRMIQAAEENRVKLGIAYYRRHYPLVQRLKALIAEGAIGVPVLTRIEAFERFNPSPEHPRRWLLDPARSGGGPMFDFGCHRIEVLLNLLGPVAETTGVVSNALYHRAVEDTAAALFRFASGSIAMLAVSHAAEQPSDTLTIYGSKATIQVPSLNGPDLHLAGAGRDVHELHPAPENLHQPLIEQFVAAVLDDQAPSVDGYVGREVNRLLAGVYT